MANPSLEGDSTQIGVPGLKGANTGQGDGVEGSTNSPFVPTSAVTAGVWGDNQGGGPGVKGTSKTGNGVIGFSTSPAAAVSAVNTGSGGAAGTQFPGLFASGSPAGEFQGPVTVEVTAPSSAEAVAIKGTLIFGGGNNSVGVWGVAGAYGVLGAINLELGLPGTPTGPPTVQGGAGVYGYGGGGFGVVGGTNSLFVGGSGGTAGVWGDNQGGGAGVKGTSQAGNGVLGSSKSKAAAGVSAINDGGGLALFAQGSPAAQFEGDCNMTGNHNVTGNTTITGDQTVTGNATVAGSHLVKGDAAVTGKLTVDIDISLSAADCAEEFDVVECGEIEPGTVMVLDQTGTLQPSEHAYDKKVAGVISGAGQYRPGLILDKVPSTQKRMAVALMGKVYCKVDAQYAPIETGDLLTTSPTLGHAMRADDHSRAFGAVIGKALRPLSRGQGLVPVLISLQ